MPADGEDCLCRDCLRSMVRAAQRGARMMERSNISAVLLDMDGTLLDTERVYFESLIAALSSRGYTDDVASLCHAMVGLPGPECEALLIAQYGEDFPLAAISRAFIANRDEILRNGLPLKAGAVELLDALRAVECPMAIVTSSSRQSADQHLSLAGIRSRFETILTRDDVTRCKQSRSLSTRGRAARRAAGGLRCGRGFQPRRHRGARRRRHHHHGARHGAADRRVTRKMRRRRA